MRRQEHAPKIRYAVIGAGNIAQVAVLPAFAHAKENSELAAIISSDERKRKVLSARYGVTHTGNYDQLEEVLVDAKVTAAYITLPNHLHRTYCERLAKLGVHVLCEKPMAMTEQDCLAMISACDRAHVKLMIAYRLHFEEGTLAAMALARSGTLGEISFVSSSFSHCVREGDIRTKRDTGGGALFDLGPYPVNAARQLFQTDPVEVFAFGRKRVNGEVDDVVSAMLRFENGRFAQFTISQADASTSTYRIVGSKGHLLVDHAYEYESGLVHQIAIDDRVERRHYTRGDQFGPELVYFSRCIQRNREPEPNGEEGLCDVRILAALRESFTTGRAIVIKPHPSRSHFADMRQEMHMPPIRKPKPVHAPSPSQ